MCLSIHTLLIWLNLFFWLILFINLLWTCAKIEIYSVHEKVRLKLAISPAVNVSVVITFVIVKYTFLGIQNILFVLRWGIFKDSLVWRNTQTFLRVSSQQILSFLDYAILMLLHYKKIFEGIYCSGQSYHILLYCSVLHSTFALKDYLSSCTWTSKLLLLFYSPRFIF